MCSYKFHGKNRDQFLDKNGLNESSAPDVKDTIDKKHSKAIVGIIAPTLVTPEHIGQLYRDTVNSKTYVATGILQGNWEEVSSASVKTTTFNLPATTIANGEHLQLYRFTVPVGKSVRVWAAGLSSEAGTSVANTKIKIYNETDGIEEYSTNSLYVDGNPIITLALAGKDISIDISNDSGLSGDFHGFITISVE